MIVLGICDGHDSGACLAKEGIIQAAVSEERLSGKKRQPGFPFRAVNWCLTSTKTPPDAVDRIFLAERSGRGAHRLLNRWYSRTDPNLPMNRRMNRLSMAWQNFVAQTAGIASVDARVSKRIIQGRLNRLGFRGSVELVDHHFAHAVSAAKSACFDEALIVTQDAFGDGISGAVFLWKEGRMERLQDQPYPHSPALLYGLVTSYLGFEEGDEGKVAGLAATGDASRSQQQFEYFLKLEKSGFRMTAFPTPFRLRSLFRNTPPMDIAAGLQAYVEGLVGRYICAWMNQTSMRRLCLAGGLFANVRLNQRVAEGCECDDLFVFPHMGDGGLCAVALMEGRSSLTRFDLFLGPTMESSETATGDPVSQKAVEEIARTLAEGGVVGIASGPMEFGPRALGNRSLLFSAQDVELAGRVNQALDRPAIMPFAPAIRDCDWEKVTSTPPWSAFSAMACTAEALPGVADRFPVAVHKDGSMRAQRVRREETPLLYDILTAYAGHVAPALLINTSFNRHEKPMFNHAAEAWKLFEEIPLQGMVLDEHFIRRDR